MASAIYELCAAIDHRFTGSYFGANKELFWPHSYFESHFLILFQTHDNTINFLLSSRFRDRKLFFPSFRKTRHKLPIQTAAQLGRTRRSPNAKKLS